MTRHCVSRKCQKINGFCFCNLPKFECNCLVVNIEVHVLQSVNSVNVNIILLLIITFESLE